MSDETRLPPAQDIDIHVAAVAAGREVVAMPGSNPALSPTLNVIGLPREGWWLHMTDAAGTEVFSLILRCHE